MTQPETDVIVFSLLTTTCSVFYKMRNWGKQMLRYISIAILAMLLTVFVGVSDSYAQSWQWPTEMSIAGYGVTGIRGSVGSDGSGSASGMLQISGVGSQKISLNRSSRGDISGKATLSGRASGMEVQGNLALNGSGLQGNGKSSLGNLSIPSKFSGSGGSFNVNGSVSVQRQEDTDLAIYRFDGTMNLQCSQGRITLVANGQVQRTGKLANQVTNYSVSNISVNPSNGTGTVSVGGVKVVFKFF